MSTRTAGDDGGREADAPGAGPTPPLSVSDLCAWVARCERLLVRHRAYLDRLDAQLGDGDHGENMGVGFGDAVRALRDEADGRDAGELLRLLGQVIVASVGGAGGSLYGTAFVEAGIAVVGREALGLGDLAVAIDAAAEGLARRGRCRTGDKTIYDALRPAADALLEADRRGDDLATAVRAAARAAHRGMVATRPLVARRGLALRLGERSRGLQDPGATSCFLLLRAMLPLPGPAA